MEAHSVPQNVTNFEFHLVGDMTLKQFGYLAFGLGFAYLIFFLFATPAPLLAWPIVIISSITGIAFAFLPIKERSLDHWVGAFFNAIFKPTMFEYKSSVVLKEDPFFKKRLNFYLSQLGKEPVTQIAWGLTPSVPTTTPEVQQEPESARTPKKEEKEETKKSSGHPNLPSKEELEQTVELAKKARSIQSKIVETQQELNRVKASAALPGANPKTFTMDFQAVMNNLRQLNEEASKISKELAISSKSPTDPLTTPAIKAKSTPIITLTSIPNILNGIVTDNLGNYLEGAILVAHDKQNLPVRALKTNKLGQFIAATPLPNGNFKLTTEKDNLLFDVVQTELTGQVLQPIIISAKRGPV